jgi:hypothetical protein
MSSKDMDNIDLTAGRGKAPHGQPYRLLDWDRMYLFRAKGLLLIHGMRSYRYVTLTSAGCREAERRLKCKSK